jgi:hypothetical protein
MNRALCGLAATREKAHHGLTRIEAVGVSLDRGTH